jgi:hypothetical protein
MGCNPWKTFCDFAQIAGFFAVDLILKPARFEASEWEMFHVERLPF